MYTILDRQPLCFEGAMCAILIIDHRVLLFIVFGDTKNMGHYAFCVANC